MDPYAGFAAIYDAWSGHMTEDVDFYVDLALEVNGPIVELAVGTGRIAIPVARAVGRPVIGIDVSPAMLAVARERAAAAGVRLDLREGDMRKLYVPADNRLTVTLESGDSVTLWWVARSEWEALIDVSGLEVEALYGWFDRSPFDEESREFVWVARKPA